MAGGLQKTHTCAIKCTMAFKVIQGHFCTNRKRVWDFLSVNPVPSARGLGSAVSSSSDRERKCMATSRRPCVFVYSGTSRSHLLPQEFDMSLTLHGQFANSVTFDHFVRGIPSFFGEENSLTSLYATLFGADFFADVPQISDS